jgi:TRAP-type C4-dicarboxylate transport system permease small subunit
MNKRLNYLLNNFEEVILGILFVNMCLFVLIQIVSRYIFKSPLLFTEEAARYSYVWITFFGMAVATKLENHIRIDLLFNLTKGKAQAIGNLVVNLVSLLLYAAVFVIGAQYTLSNTIQVSPAMEIPKAIIYASLPLGALVSIFRLLMLIQRDVQKMRSPKMRSE